MSSDGVAIANAFVTAVLHVQQHQNIETHTKTLKRVVCQLFEKTYRASTEKLIDAILAEFSARDERKGTLDELIEAHSDVETSKTCIFLAFTFPGKLFPEKSNLQNIINTIRAEATWACGLKSIPTSLTWTSLPQSTSESRRTRDTLFQQAGWLVERDNEADKEAHFRSTGTAQIRSKIDPLTSQQAEITHLQGKLEDFMKA